MGKQTGLVQIGLASYDNKHTQTSVLQPERHTSKRSRLCDGHFGCSSHLTLPRLSESLCQRARADQLACVFSLVTATREDTRTLRELPLLPRLFFSLYSVFKRCGTKVARHWECVLHVAGPRALSYFYPFQKRDVYPHSPLHLRSQLTSVVGLCLLRLLQLN